MWRRNNGGRRKESRRGHRGVSCRSWIGSAVPCGGLLLSFDLHASVRGACIRLASLIESETLFPWFNTTHFTFILVPFFFISFSSHLTAVAIGAWQPRHPTASYPTSPFFSSFASFSLSFVISTHRHQHFPCASIYPNQIVSRIESSVLVIASDSGQTWPRRAIAAFFVGFAPTYNIFQSRNASVRLFRLCGGFSCLGDPY